ncbi:MAG: NUDIX hydrolase [Flavobacteriaceae bacterium]|nr:MAG: NUDIX hydrolase [Flavobacteriaceae bacterium]
MYKVFVNERPLIFTNNMEDIEADCLLNCEEIDFKKVVDKLFNNHCSSQLVYCPDLKKVWRQFKANFKVEKAAGGLVYNDKDELLFIHRFGKWDLPKGHIEKGEAKKKAAIREVEEECGISELKIEKKLSTTYHMFIRKGSMILKITYWYQMFSNDKGQLVPQIEEGIDAVCFKSKTAQQIAMTNSYENIILLLKTSENLN